LTHYLHSLQKSARIILYSTKFVLPFKKSIIILFNIKYALRLKLASQDMGPSFQQLLLPKRKMLPQEMQTFPFFHLLRKYKEI